MSKLSRPFFDFYCHQITGLFSLDHQNYITDRFFRLIQDERAAFLVE